MKTGDENNGFRQREDIIVLMYRKILQTTLKDICSHQYRDLKYGAGGIFFQVAFYVPCLK